MTKGNKIALTLSMVGALGLGIWIGNEIAGGSMTSDKQEAAPVAAAAPAAAPVSAKQPRAAVRTTRRPATAAAAATTATTPATAAHADAAERSSVAVSSPDLQARLRSVLNRGANLNVAAEGFRDGEQFATLAHAARNTAVPFMLLKHRVLVEGKSLADAIHESKPELDAEGEADRARNEARADVSAISSN
jgi:hypothetical protein